MIELPFGYGTGAEDSFEMGGYGFVHATMGSGPSTIHGYTLTYGHGYGFAYSFGNGMGDGWGWGAGDYPFYMTLRDHDIQV